MVCAVTLGVFLFLKAVVELKFSMSNQRKHFPPVSVQNQTTAKLWLQRQGLDSIFRLRLPKRKQTLVSHRRSMTANLKHYKQQKIAILTMLLSQTILQSCDKIKKQIL